MAMTYDEYIADCLEWEKYRHENPACCNCNYYYEDCGSPCCRYWDEPLEDYINEHCTNWK